MRVIGTAGHVDHGKSTLVRALTGIDPDRLREEKKRQMTIDLGFAWYESEEVGAIGIVDVPGHKDFIENMLAGVGGIDAVLLVIAADEGVMPQTKEHLSIINLLDVKTGIVVLTKVDMVDDVEWVDLVEADVREYLSGSALEFAPILRVSAVTGYGVAELRAAIDNLLAPLNPRLDKGKPRLAVDRVFSMTGFGTVVTGTLLDGTIHIEDEIEILPKRVTGRIRGLQSHKKRESMALPGSRTAINIAGVDIADVDRGAVVAAPGVYRPTRRIDAKLEILPDAVTGVKHNDQVKVFILTSESAGRVRLLQKQEIKPGEVGWVQIEFEKEVVVANGDRFILRRMSPAQTIGGGVVVEAHSASRYKLADSAVLESLERKIAPGAENQVLTAVVEKPFSTREEILANIDGGSSSAVEEIGRLVDANQLVELKPAPEQSARYITTAEWQRLTSKMLDLVDRYHKQFPLRIGINGDELARKIRITNNELALCKETWKRDHQIIENAGILAFPSFEIIYSPNQARRLDQYYGMIEKDPYNPPSVKEARDMLTDELYQSLIDQGMFILLSSEVVIRKGEFEQMLEYVKAEIANLGSITLAQFRDHFYTSRRVSQAFLEYLDRKGVTVREGEGRRLT